MKHLTPYRQNETSLSPVRGKGMGLVSSYREQINSFYPVLYIKTLDMTKVLSRISLIISSAERLSFHAPTKRFAQSGSVFAFFAGTNDFTKASIFVIADSLSRRGLISRNNSARNSIAVMSSNNFFLASNLRIISE